MARGGGAGSKKATAELPAPLTPAECTMSGYPAIPIDVDRLRQSDFDNIADDTAWRAGMNLWLSSWQSVPAGSLKDDDSALAKAAGLGRDLVTWRRVKPEALSGFLLCSDGRLYHPTVSIFALAAWVDKLIRRHSGARGNRGNRPDQQRAAELNTINRQISNAGRCLSALDHLHPALQKVRKHAAQCEPQCGPDQPALGPQYNGSEGNGSKSKGPIQEGAEVIRIGEARA